MRKPANQRAYEALDQTARVLSDVLLDREKDDLMSDDQVDIVQGAFRRVVRSRDLLLRCVERDEANPSDWLGELETMLDGLPHEEEAGPPLDIVQKFAEQHEEHIVSAGTDGDSPTIYVVPKPGMVRHLPYRFMGLDVRVMEAGTIVPAAVEVTASCPDIMEQPV